MESIAEQRRQLAISLNTILKRIYKNIHEDKFDTNIDLSDIRALDLKNFWVYTSGYIGVKNNDEIDDILTDSEMNNMLSGKFALRYMSKDQAKQLADKAGVKLNPSRGNARTNLYNIQDGTYYLESQKPLPNSYITAPCLCLETNCVEFCTDHEDYYVNYTNRDFFKLLRNSFAHSVPFIDNNELVFEKPNGDQLIISKMWLRGYTELFARNQMIIDSKQLSERLHEELLKDRNYIDNLQDIDKALSTIKDLFPENIQDKYFRVNNFVKKRILFTKDFFSKSLDDKISIICNVCANNPQFLQSGNQSSSSSVLYNIENLVSNELHKRDEKADGFDIDDPDFVRALKLTDELEQAEKDMKDKINRRLPFAIIKRKNQEIQKMYTELKKLFESLERRRELESSHMDMHEITELEHLPVEVAVNTVLLTAFNNMITSSFYEDLLSETDTLNLSKKQNDFFAKFNTSKINKTLYGKKYTMKDKGSDNAFTLIGLRNALVHGGVRAILPNVKEGQNVSYKDVILEFNAETQNMVFTGTVEDFYELFMSSGFTCKRPKDIVIPSKYTEDQPDPE